MSVNTTINSAKDEKVDKILKPLLIIICVLGIVLGICLGIHLIDTNLPSEEVELIKEHIVHMWENGVQLECNGFTLKNTDKNINLYNLVNKPLSSPENADVEFWFNMNDFAILRKENKFMASDFWSIKNIEFTFEGGSLTTNAYVSNVLVVILYITFCLFSVVILMILVCLIGGLFLFCFSRNSKSCREKKEYN